MGIESIIPIAAAALNLFGGSSKGSQTTEQKPMAYEPEMKDIWDEYVDLLTTEDPNQPGLKTFLSEDDLAQRRAVQDYLNKSTGYSDDLVTALDTAMKDYGYNTPLKAKIGGQDFSFVPGQSRRTARDLLDVATQKHAVRTGDAKTGLEFALQFTPYRAARQYIDQYLKPEASAIQDRRYSLPTTTQSAEYTEPLANTLMRSLYLAQPALKNWQNTGNQNTESITSGQWPYM